MLTFPAGPAIPGKNREQPAIPLFIIPSRKDLLNTYYVQGAKLQTVKNDSDKRPQEADILGWAGG